MIRAYLHEQQRQPGQELLPADRQPARQAREYELTISDHNNASGSSNLTSFTSLLLALQQDSIKKTKEGIYALKTSWRLDLGSRSAICCDLQMTLLHSMLHNKGEMGSLFEQGMSLIQK